MLDEAETSSTAEASASNAFDDMSAASHECEPDSGVQLAAQVTDKIFDFDFSASSYCNSTSSAMHELTKPSSISSSYNTWGWDSASAKRERRRRYRRRKAEKKRLEREKRLR
jgi:hypothetical protein